MGALGALGPVAAFLFDGVIGPGLMFLYPLYAFKQAIERRSISEQRYLLTYWILYSFITLFELSFRRILLWLPFWNFAKLLFCIWFISPQSNGAGYIYQNYLAKLASSFFDDSNPKKEPSDNPRGQTESTQEMLMQNESAALQEIMKRISHRNA